MHKAGPLTTAALPTSTQSLPTILPTDSLGLIAVEQSLPHDSNAAYEMLQPTKDEEQQKRTERLCR